MLALQTLSKILHNPFSSKGKNIWNTAILQQEIITSDKAVNGSTEFSHNIETHFE